MGRGIFCTILTGVSREDFLEEFIKIHCKSVRFSKNKTKFYLKEFVSYKPRVFILIVL